MGAYVLIDEIGAIKSGINCDLTYSLTPFADMHVAGALPPLANIGSVDASRALNKSTEHGVPSILGVGICNAAVILFGVKCTENAMHSPVGGNGLARNVPLYGRVLPSQGYSSLHSAQILGGLLKNSAVGHSGVHAYVEQMAQDAPVCMHEGRSGVLCEHRISQGADEGFSASNGLWMVSDFIFFCMTIVFSPLEGYGFSYVNAATPTTAKKGDETKGNGVYYTNGLTSAPIRNFDLPSNLAFSPDNQMGRWDTEPENRAALLAPMFSDIDYAGRRGIRACWPVQARTRALLSSRSQRGRSATYVAAPIYEDVHGTAYYAGAQQLRVNKPKKRPKLS